MTLPAVPAQSRERDRTLKLYFGHTGERGEFTFKRNGSYDRRELTRINHFLRDWRKGEDAKMDPHLLDLVWAIYDESGSKDYIHVVSAYRSPQTNEMLRSRSSGVAKNSQHRLGKAMDWYVTDVKLADLRAVAMKMQGGGVGYYPRSGSPFIHTDTGNVRAWPRMSRQQLIALFPNGNTLHLPADGKPLPGYEQAVAQRKTQGATALAYLETEAEDGEGGATATAAAAAVDRTGTDAGTRTWLARVFPGDEADHATRPSPAVESAVAVAAGDDAFDTRVPRPRPGSEGDAGAAPTVLASADANGSNDFVMGALSGQVPSAEAYGIGTRRAPTADAGDAIASLISTGEGDAAPPRPRPAQLAYAPADPTLDILSAADNAIIAAFAAVDQSGVVNEGDAALVAALMRQTAGAGEDVEDEAPVPGLIFAAADLGAYEGDEDVLLDLIEASAPADPSVASLAMPRPQHEEALFVAPGAASEVADLRGASGPPVERFATATAERPRQEEGFFTRLFASLIE